MEKQVKRKETCDKKQKDYHARGENEKEITDRHLPVHVYGNAVISILFLHRGLCLRQERSDTAL